MNLVSAIRNLRTFAFLTLVTGLCSCCVSDTTSDFTARRNALGRTLKIRLMVDKVAMRDNEDNYMTEKHIQMYAQAGFNVLVPRNGADDYDYVREMAKLAGRYNVFYMPWIRGGRYTPDDRRSDIPAIPQRKKIVSKDGVVQTKYSPNSEELWTWFTETILTYARISTREPAIIGVFIDYENYAQPRGPNREKLIGNLYSISYDQDIIDEFTKTKEINMPKLPPNQRHTWLIENNLLESFTQFQYQQWRIRARKLRRAVDAINPKFQFGVYPFQTPFIQQAAWQEFSSKQAPVIIGDPSTYGRPKAMNHLDGLKENQRLMREKGQFVEDFKRQNTVHLKLLGGIDPIVDQVPDQEFTGKNAAMISENSDGYWVFYELDKSLTDAEHKKYVEWFSQANQAISEGRYDFWHEERQTPDPIDQSVNE